MRDATLLFALADISIDFLQEESKKNGMTEAPTGVTG